MPPQLTYNVATRQISKARCLARVLAAEDTKGSGPAGVLLVDQDPARGRVVVNNLDTVSAMIRGQCGVVVQEFGHAKLSGRLEYDADSGETIRLEVAVSGQEGQGVQYFWIQRQDDGALCYRWKMEAGPEASVTDHDGQLFWQGSPLLEKEVLSQ